MKPISFWSIMNNPLFPSRRAAFVYWLERKRIRLANWIDEGQTDWFIIGAALLLVILMCV